MALQTPILTSVEPDQLEKFRTFVAQLRGDNTFIAEEEAQRLRDYLKAYGQVLSADQAAARHVDPKAKALANPHVLRRLFNQVAVDTKNTVLSGIIIAPDELLDQKEALEGTTQFFATSVYWATKGQFARTFFFGFIQTFEDDKNGSTAIPVLALNTGLMLDIEPYNSAAMLKALQTVATSSNHDMQHHYTSTILNPRIAQTVEDKRLPSPDFNVKDWSDLYFNHAEKDSDPRSYESWLMLNHARVRRLMEEGPEGEALKKACDDCLAELRRIGEEMTASLSAQKAHEVVDYFGTMMLFSMARSMPLNHPLMEYAIRGLQQADPMPEATADAKDDIVDRVQNHKAEKKREFIKESLANYKAHGFDLLPEEHDYVSLKKLQLLMIEPWVIHVMSPSRPDTDLATAQERVSEVNRDMITSSAMTSWFNAVDGLHTITRPDGSVTETYFKDGVLHRADGPAIVQKDAAGNVICQQWLQNGKRFREDGEPDFFKVEGADDKRTETKEWHDEKGRLRHQLKTSPDSAYRKDVYKESWYDENGKEHRDGGPSSLLKDAAGNVIQEEWKQHGKYYREDGPSIIKVETDGTRMEKWAWDKEVYHREDGPALVMKNPESGFSREEWFQNGKHHREGGPAVIKNFTTGASEESWYKNGKLHNENGPAYITIDKDGIRREKWYINGEAIDTPPVKQPTATGTKPPALS